MTHLIYARFLLLAGFIAAVIVVPLVWNRLHKTNLDTPEQDREDSD